MTTALLAVLAIWQADCRPVADAAWQAYRADSLDAAAAGFERLHRECPFHPTAQVGLGFVALRRGAPLAARARFRAATRLAPESPDAWYGLGLALGRLDARVEAVAALRRALRLAPHYGDVEDALLGLGVDSGLAPPARPPTEPTIAARTAGEQFEIPAARGWRPFYIKGINLGVARPGRFPSEFPTDDSTYLHWLGLIAAANANTVRVYTILPPVFYRALARWNAAHPRQLLWLVHGVWTEPPPDDDYDDAAWEASFQNEMRRVADVLHGRARIGARPGHAWGRYDADVSAHTLGFIIGREWEPAALARHNTQHAARTAYAGRFLSVARGTPADAWMAEQCDYLLAYEWDTYRAARPIAYTNWPTLDPLHHPTEPTGLEEQALRRRAALPPHPRLQEYDNDGGALDAMVVQPTASNKAGFFAAYHAYPYYPDFIALDTAYAPAHYLGYLRALRRHHAGRPVVIAEYGVPSSRGVAHLGPDGQDHGGHDEDRMAAIDVALTRDIRAAGVAGGILFAWLDEWFKHNWLVIDLELPADRTPLWHNVEDAEQNYGLLGQYAGTADGPAPGGDPGPWRALPVQATRSGATLRAGADEAYLYVALDGAPAADRYAIGIDTYRPDRGVFHLPGLTQATDFGLEFVLLVSPGGAELRVARHYNPFLVPNPRRGPTQLDAFYNLAATVDARSDEAAYDSLFVTTNRFRIARDGRTFPARGVNRGRLLAVRDWFWDAATGLLTVRLPWNLLNVTDPSSHRVLAAVRQPGPFLTAETEGFRFVVAASRGGTEAWRLQSTAPFRWAGWEQPTWHERLKPAYAAMQTVWGEW